MIGSMSGDKDTPRLYGLVNTSRDFSRRNAWGKNQFNSSFPAALCCYLHAKKLNANYLAMQNGRFVQTKIPIPDIFQIAPDDPDIFFAFESIHSPYQKYVIGTLPRVDLVIQAQSTGRCLSGLEIKLTALPDNTTYDLDQSRYGCEIVVRPDSIVYLACSIAAGLNTNLSNTIVDLPISDWSDAHQVLPYIPTIIDSIHKVAVALESNQTPFIIQPIWKTIGKSPLLAEQCFDVFAWSDAGFAHFIAEISNRNPNATRINRQTRTAIWLYKMLLDVAQNGQFDHAQIIDVLSYNTKNDKAFASAGNITNRFMSCPRLVTPAISKDEIKQIILGGGQNLLSPERRLDAILVNSPDLFSEEA